MGKSQFQEFIAKSKYCRWLDGEQRRETFEEAVKRYTSFFKEHLKARCGYDVSDDYINQLERSILAMEDMPSMRALMTAGPALKRDEIAGYNCSATTIKSLRGFDEIIYILMCGVGAGFSCERQFVNELPNVPEELYETDSTISVRDSKIGWAKAYKELLGMLYSGNIPKWDDSKLRKAGSKLKTFGGRSSGPEPLRELVDFTIRVFKGAKGRKLTSIEVHDIVCYIAQIIVVGGVRRCLPEGSQVHTKSGLLPIEDVAIGAEVLTSNGYRRVKDKFYQGKQELVRVQTQDSFFECTPNHKVAVLTEKDVYTWKEAGSLQEGDRLIAPSFAVEGEKLPFPEYSYVFPKMSTTCKTITIPELDEEMAWFIGLFHGNGYARLTSKSGQLSLSFPTESYTNVAERAKKQFERFGVNAKIEHSKQGNWGNVRVKSKQLADFFYKHIKQPSTDIVIPDFIKMNVESIRLAYLSGLFDADGSAKTRPLCLVTSVYPDFVIDVQRLASSLGYQTRFKEMSTSGLKDGWKPKYSVVLINTPAKRMIAESTYSEKKVDIKISKTESFTNTYPKGYSCCEQNYRYPWSNTDGKLIPVSVVSVDDVEGEIETWDIEVEDMHEFFCNGYLMHNSALISLSNLSDDRMRNAKSGQWWVDNPQRALANNSVAYTEKPDMHTFMKEWYALYGSKSGERGVFNRQAAVKQIDRSNKLRKEWFGDKAALRDTNHVFNVNPCGEILLRPEELCNLSEAVVRSSDTIETLKEKLSFAATTGTWQSTLTNFRYVNSRWKKNCEEERLLGVSLTGEMSHYVLSGQKDRDEGICPYDDNSHIAKMLLELRKHVVSENMRVADEIGINYSVACTTVKPSGTVSQLVNCSSGLHPWHNDYYIRTARGDKKDPLSMFMVDNGFPHEEDYMNPSAWVFSFPVKADDGGITRNDLTAIEMLEVWLAYKKFWCEHNPSVTINVRDNEWMEVGAWVYKHFDEVCGVSFLPYSDHVYRQAPYQDCTKEEYEAMCERMPKDVDWSGVSEYEKEDTTTGMQEYACSAGVCEIVDISK